MLPQLRDDDSPRRVRARAVATLSLFCGVLTAVAPAADAQLVANPRLGNPARGAEAFAECARCHSLEPGKNMQGPTLHGLLGRRIGSVPGFRYSPALRRSPLVWDEDRLSEYLADPRRFASDDKAVSSCRVKDPNRLGDLLAYLERTSR